ncbi:hypothetical protein N7491_005097 [Penicillium cf. griseofulvum]|uniref:Uncharacterized protein n=1 Tax=Penicillium cf. griseofulvum TaxID=2972120 RepID=A0A9W9J6Y7_9EURO|nr:hypothetical protein N7472_007790 [Penicillium cf. griseofulvum]KAJ5434502.1 hypothetical protein N7491_005097 [Penicillium cf. griseofulvum]KAJ5452332.1 hypothetical protein N7445_000515 [Penicillium cf. griseofulvum]
MSAQDHMDQRVNDLDFEFSFDQGNYPLDGLKSLQDVFSAVQHEKHFSNSRNFSSKTEIRCFDVNGHGIIWMTTLSVIYYSFVPLTPAADTSFGNCTAMTRENTRELFQTIKVNPLFIMNLLGRPDYWAPQTQWHTEEDGSFLACDFFCQYARWNLHALGAPVSVYMRYDAALNLTTYILSHKDGDSSIRVLSEILGSATKIACSDKRADIFFNDPFDIAITLSTLSFEASKYHVKGFRRFLWSQINKVDEYFSDLENAKRDQVSGLTRSLQVISHNADAHLNNAEVTTRTATTIRTIHGRLHEALPWKSQIYESSVYSIDYVIESLQKQKMWFQNYKSLQENTLMMVSILVSQQDAASNIQLATSMKRDSTSMNAIAALTMVFLPGTFIAVSIKYALTILANLDDLESLR